MREYTPKALCILGRQPQLGMAELERRYGADKLQPLVGAALLDMDAFEIKFVQLGGTLKVARLLNTLPTTKWDELISYLVENVPGHLKALPGGSFTIGLSLYGFNVRAEQINRSLLKLKKHVKATGRSIRVVPNKQPSLNTAQVLHNQLTRKGGWELILFKNGQETLLAQTVFVQDINAYAARDQARPARDARVGMLPPKLAQIIINLANPPVGSRLLDPFCGTGVILQEAFLMSLSVTGTDVDPRMVEFSETNLQWLRSKYPDILGKPEICQADARTRQWSNKIDTVATEIYLGEPLQRFPESRKLKEIISKVEQTLEAFLKNLRSQITDETIVSLAVPAWRDTKSFIRLPLIDRLPSIGYNRLDFKHVRADDLVYFRPNQIVARELITLRRTK